MTLPIAFAICLFNRSSLAESNGLVERSRLPRTILLVYHNDKDQAALVKSKADWKQRRAVILRGMEEIMGPLPGKEKCCALDVQAEQEVDCGSYLRRLITYAAEPMARLPGYLLIAKQGLSL